MRRLSNNPTRSNSTFRPPPLPAHLIPVYSPAHPRGLCRQEEHPLIICHPPISAHTLCPPAPLPPPPPPPPLPPVLPPIPLPTSHSKTPVGRRTPQRCQASRRKRCALKSPIATLSPPSRRVAPRPLHQAHCPLPDVQRRPARPPWHVQRLPVSCPLPGMPLSSQPPPSANNAPFTTHTRPRPPSLDISGTTVPSTMRRSPPMHHHHRHRSPARCWSEARVCAAMAPPRPHPWGRCRPRHWR